MFDVALVRKRFSILAWNSGTGEKTWNELSVVIWKEDRYKSENKNLKITKSIESSQSLSFRACAPAQELEMMTTMTENDKRN